MRPPKFTHFPTWMAGRPEDGEGMEELYLARVSILFTLLMAEAGAGEKQAESAFRTINTED